MAIPHTPASQMIRVTVKRTLGHRDSEQQRRGMATLAARADLPQIA
jgi:hypothetical protein